MSVATYSAHLQSGKFPISFVICFTVWEENFIADAADIEAQLLGEEDSNLAAKFHRD